MHCNFDGCWGNTNLNLNPIESIFRNNRFFYLSKTFALRRRNRVKMMVVLFQTLIKLPVAVFYPESNERISCVSACFNKRLPKYKDKNSKNFGISCLVTHKKIYRLIS